MLVFLSKIGLMIVKKPDEIDMNLVSLMGSWLEVFLQMEPSDKRHQTAVWIKEVLSRELQEGVEDES